jgi:hypothetical protein
LGKFQVAIAIGVPAASGVGAGGVFPGRENKRLAAADGDPKSKRNPPNEDFTRKFLRFITSIARLFTRKTKGTGFPCAVPGKQIAFLVPSVAV